MKTIFLAVSVLFSMRAFSSTPIFSKFWDSGYAPEQYYFQKNCEVFSDKVVITTDTSEGSTTLEKLIEADPTWATQIKAASAGFMQRVVSPADFPRDISLAFYTLPNNTIKEVILVIQDGNGSKVVNSSKAAKALKVTLDKLCNE